MIHILCISSLVLSESACTTLKTVHDHHSRDSLEHLVHKKVNNTYVHDSIYIRERADTIFIDHWHTRLRDSIVVELDTVIVVQRDSIPYPVYINSPSPPGEGVRGMRLRVYRFCSGCFFIVLGLILLYFVIKFLLRAHFRL